MCVVSNFHPGVKKMLVEWKIWNFHHRFKFHQGLAKPSWDFNSVYGVEIFACNCNIILRMNLLFSRDEISTRLTSWNFSPVWKSPYNLHISLEHYKVEKHLTSLVSLPQNGRTHSNNLSTVANKWFKCVWLFCGVGALKG